MKKVVRGIVITFMFILFGFGALFIRYLIFPFQKSKTENYETLQKSWKFFISLMEFSGLIKVKINDYEKITNIKNSIIVSTHPSFIDVVVLMSIIPHTTCFVAQKLTKNPFFKGMVDLLFIPDGNSTDELSENVRKKLDEGLNVIIFPMGGRHEKHEYPKIRRGASLIAQKTGKNIAALNIDTSYGFLRGQKPFYDAGPDVVVFSIDYLGMLDTNTLLQTYPDEVTFKTETTKQITNILYADKK